MNSKVRLIEERVAEMKEVLKTPPKDGDLNGMVRWTRELYRLSAAAHSRAKTMVVDDALNGDSK